MPTRCIPRHINIKLSPFPARLSPVHRPPAPPMPRTRIPMNPPAFLPCAPIPFPRAKPPLPTPRLERHYSTATSNAPTARLSHPRPSLSSIAHSINTRSTEPHSLITSTLSHINAIEPDINAFLSIDVPHIESQLSTLPPSQPLPLAGVPFAVKDNICVSNLPTTAASAILDSFVPSYNATAVQRLLSAGALHIGKTNLDEFGMGSSTEFSAYAVTKNPWDLSRVPGGSSGGSAAAVAAGMVPLALGTDTGGSIRLPAALCGVTGLKPSYGRVSRYGLLSYASSLDTVGPIANSVEDCALALKIMAGADGMDATAVNDEVPDYVAALADHSLKGLVIAVVEDAMEAGVEKEVADSVRKAAEVLGALGAEIRHVTFGGFRAAVPSYYVIALAEASANLARYDGVRYGNREEGANTAEMYVRSRGRGLGKEVRRRIMAGTYALSSGYYDAYYRKAQRVRAKVASNFRRLFDEGVDILIHPVSTTPALKMGEVIKDPVAMYWQDALRIPANLAGLPALSVPVGTTRGLPVGLQLVAPLLQEEMLLRVGHAFQCATDHHLQTSDVLDERLAACVKN